MPKKGEKVQFAHALGAEVTETETVTGFTGVITAQFHYLNGCKRYLVEAKADKPAAKPEELAYDEDRLEPTKAPKAEVRKTPTGGPPSRTPPARQRLG